MYKFSLAHKQEAEGKGVTVEKSEHILMFSAPSEKGRAIQAAMLTIGVVTARAGVPMTVVDMIFTWN